MSRSFSAVFLLSLVVGCAVAPMGGPGAPAVSPAPLPSYGDLVFTDLSPDGAELLSSEPDPLLNPLAASPDPARLDVPYVPFAASGNVGAVYDFVALAGETEGPPAREDGAKRLALAGVEQTFLPGFQGDVGAWRLKVLDPLFKGWAADASFTRGSMRGVELAGVSPSPEVCGRPPTGNRWTFTGVSASRTEALRLRVDASRTLLVRMKWAAPEQAPALAPNGGALPMGVSREEAIRRLTAAIETAAFQGEEERTRREYFLNTPYAEPSISAGAGPQTALYRVPAQAPWRAETQQILGKPVWILRYDMTPSPSPSPPSYRLLCSGPPPRLVEVPRAYGMVDATNGAVIRFIRPVRMFRPE